MVCGWDISYERCTGSRDKAFLDSLDATIKARSEEFALELLYGWTGSKYGVCEHTETLRTRPADDCYQVPAHSPYPKWTSPRGRTSRAVSELRLSGPIHRITSLSIDGQAVPLSDLTSQGRRVWFLDGSVWAPNATIEVTYERGIPVPTGGQIVAGVLALEIAKFLCGNSSCALPERVKSVTRQGVSLDMIALDTFEDLDEGKTGIWIVDAWMASIRKKPRGYSIGSPDTLRR